MTEAEKERAGRGCANGTSRWLPEERGPIWDYASKMGKSLHGLLPKDACVTISDGVYVSCTVTTMQEAEALREVIRHLGQTLPSHRKMVAADIGANVPEPDWRAELYRVLGDPMKLTTARREHLKGTDNG